MPDSKGRQGEAWAVSVVPAGTPGEAAAAAQRARRLVAGWVIRSKETAEEREACP